MIQKACETSEMKYCGVTKDVQMKGVVLQVKRFIAEQRKAGFLGSYACIYTVHVWIPT